MFNDIKKYCQGCDTCHRTKPFLGRTQGLLQALDVPNGRWKRISIDFITKLPISSNGNDAVAAITDYATKRGHMIPMKEGGISAEVFAKLFVRKYIKLHGVPEEIMSDRDPRFVSDF